LCGVSVAAVCDVWARARAREDGRGRLVLACRHASIVVIAGAHETPQVRERVRGGGGGGVSGGDEVSLAVVQDEVHVVLQRKSCGCAIVEQEGTVLGNARRLSLSHVSGSSVSGGVHGTECVIGIDNRDGGVSSHAGIRVTTYIMGNRHAIGTGWSLIIRTHVQKPGGSVVLPLFIFVDVREMIPHHRLRMPLVSRSRIRKGIRCRKHM